MKNNKLIKLLNTLIYSLAFILLVISFSVAIPLLWRGFYYYHIDWYSLDQITGYTKEEIIYSFNALMDSLSSINLLVKVFFLIQKAE